MLYINVIRIINFCLYSGIEIIIHRNKERLVANENWHNYTSLY